MTVTLHHPRYQFDRYIAAGGMGEVWQATDTLLDREVAVKVLRRELSEDPLLRARFAAEARHAGSLQHPHVASVLDYGELEQDGQPPVPFLVMELVEGQPLSALLKDDRPLPAEVAADLIAQAAEGIEAAHALGIVHRDVKPGNLLVTATGQVKVTDFGVARAADAAALTMTGHLIGTPYYLAPEQAEGASATPVSDVYALGIVLYECLTGRKPFVGESPVATAVMQIQAPLPPLPPGVPERLRRITQVATAKDPAARFRSAGAMAAALRDESPDTRSFVLPQQDQLEDVADTREHRELLSVRRALLVLLVLLLLAGGAWASVDRSRSSSGTTASEDAASAAPPERVRVRADDFVGMDADRASGQLRALGLRPSTVPRENPGSKTPGTVAAIGPTGLLDPGTRVELAVWGPAPAPTPTAAPDGQGTRNGDGSGKGGSPDRGQPDTQGGGNGGGNGKGGSNAGGNGKGNGGGNGKGGGTSGKGGKR